MDLPELRHVQCLDGRGLRRFAYWQWGESRGVDVVVCAHGLARQGRDFDVLARALADRYCVVCPDFAGRGESDRASDPAAYALPTYVVDSLTLLARLDARRVLWVGTSMGGLIGLGLAALRASPIERLVLNDIGPTIDAHGVARIAGYLGKTTRFESEEAAADALLAISQGFGPHSREQWLALTRPMLRPDGEGFVLHYDPAIAVNLRAITPEQAATGEAALWAAYDAVRCPVLLLRGESSD
ncbi:MAG: alpha/beta hydrolase, partial [Pseudomonadota bacterium]|nr:alpha/beta hydrolase [Pseudomonadota bacterium]